MTDEEPSAPLSIWEFYKRGVVVTFSVIMFTIIAFNVADFFSTEESSVIIEELNDNAPSDVLLFHEAIQLEYNNLFTDSPTHCARFNYSNEWFVNCHFSGAYKRTTAIFYIYLDHNNSDNSTVYGVNGVATKDGKRFSLFVPQLPYKYRGDPNFPKFVKLQEHSQKIFPTWKDFSTEQMEIINEFNNKSSKYMVATNSLLQEEYGKVYGATPLCMSLNHEGIEIWFINCFFGNQISSLFFISTDPEKPTVVSIFAYNETAKDDSSKFSFPVSEIPKEVTDIEEFPTVEELRQLIPSI